MQFIKSAILIVLSILVLLFASLAFQKLHALQQNLYSLDPKQIQEVPEFLSSNFQSIYIFFSLTIVLTVLAFIYFAFIDISKEFKFAIETKRAKEEEIVKEDIDLGELEEEITESEIERKKREQINTIRKKVQQAADFSKKEHSKICEDILTLIGKEMEIVQAEIFLLKTKENENFDKYELVSTYAYYLPEEQKTEFQFGEGLIGQVAKEQEKLYIDNLPEKYIKVASGLGDALPKNLLILPIAHSQKTIGVVELASFNPISQNELDLLEAITNEIGNIFGGQMADILPKIMASTKKENIKEELKHSFLEDTQKDQANINLKSSEKEKNNDKEILEDK